MENQGLIRIHSVSPYECLDPNTTEWLNQLKQMWPLWKKNTAITEMLINFFAVSPEPYKTALKITVSSGDFFTGKQNSLSCHIMETFSNWIKFQNNLEIPKYLKVDALNLVAKQKNYALTKLVVETFRMFEEKQALVEPVQQLCRAKKYKEACQLASLLHMHDFFGIEEFVVPLVFQDKYVVAEQFLKGSKKHQVELAVFLDDLIGKKSVMNEVQSIIVYLNIHDPRLRGLSYKPLSKLLTRILKAFNLPPATCPNLSQKRGKGILQFLMHKRYVEKSIGEESWTEMVLEAIGDDETLQLELIGDVALYGDLKEALSWAERFGTPEDAWPRRLLDYKHREKDERNPVDKSLQEEEENRDGEVREATPARKFHKLPLQESQIKLIDTESLFCDFLADLSDGVSIIGIDAEWKPSFGLKKCELALIQVATSSVVYILDVIALASVACQVLWERFAKGVFENPEILKLGFGIDADMAIVKETLRKLHGIKTGSEIGFLDLGALWKTLVHEYKFVFPFGSTSKTSENLSCLIEMCLGESLDKSDQFSNWENRPLRKSQIIYAALDAYCLLEAYNVILKQCTLQNIPIADIIDETVYEAAMTANPRRRNRKKAGED